MTSHAILGIHIVALDYTTVHGACGGISILVLILPH